MTTNIEKENLHKVLEGFKEEYQDNTDYLRSERRSVILRIETLKMERLKRSYKGDIKSEEFAELCRHECHFMFTHFSMIFNKMLKDVLDLRLFFNILETLRNIENGVINQEEGSVIVGKMFAEIYLDSAKREGEKRDEEMERVEPFEGKSLTWKQFKGRNA